MGGLTSNPMQQFTADVIYILLTNTHIHSFSLIYVLHKDSITNTSNYNT
jgi:hypothetical protein